MALIKPEQLREGFFAITGSLFGTSSYADFALTASYAMNGGGSGTPFRISTGSISSSVDRTAQDAAKKKSDTYTSQIEQEQLATRRRIEELQKNQVGMSATGLSVESERINRESLSKQADLAILQTAANRDYDTAASIADRTVALKMEQSNANLAALKFFYDENKSSFTKADDRIYAEVLSKKEAENRRLERNETAIAQLKLNVAQYGGGAALLSKLSAIDTTKAEFIRMKFAGKKIGIFYKFKEELNVLKQVFGDNLTTELTTFEDTNKSIALQIVSGREGISLRNADYIVYYNIDFSATSYWQSRDRMTTKDRTNNTVYWVFSKGGIERDIYKAVSKKKDYTVNHFKKDLINK